MNETLQKDKNIPQERAQRVRTLREALRYSRQKFCDTYAKFGVTPSTLQSWEAVRWNGLTEKGAKKLVAIFREEGLRVTVEWLMYGIGEDPLGTAVKVGVAKDLAKVSQREIITQELRLFHQLNPEAVDAVISDDALAPCLLPGDHVAGQRYFDEEIDKAIGYPCIVQTMAGAILVRQLGKGQEKGCYSLLSTNPETTVTPAQQDNVKLFSAAPVLWIRKPALQF